MRDPLHRINHGSSSPLLCTHLCYLNLKWKHNSLEFLRPWSRKLEFFWIVTVLNGRSMLSISDIEGTEMARILLEKLFAQAQKLEEQMGSAELCINLYSWSRIFMLLLQP